ncbi:rhamnulokinase family protein [Actinoallomurus bryophytorum]|uniref:Rhamnulokinase n=1 Tax=Actinoallomurus bryophytorum TaxID=1490222 RepID=A0A543C1H0_9ACTN|nr:rhamnulokinase family protein [Actinoallomurus bryophytorum]TQL90914.1 rhamnulokinase [Actinoallomurus bryophytorum]
MGSYAAVDLGASSGRVMLAQLSEDRLTLHEAHRFANRPVRVAGTLYWDILGLYREILDGLRSAGGADSIGIDSWAVDYGLLDSSGALIGNPVHYRDSRTDGVMERVVGQIGADTLYDVGGLQFLPFNTVYQLVASAPPPRARTLLMIPDLLTYWLTGETGAEVTNASTTGLYDVRAGEWAYPLIERLGLSRRLFTPLRRPGTTAGTLRPEVAAETGLPSSLPVTAVGSHDTASAVFAVPASDDRFGYVSCGTWSLAGVELTAPVLTAESRRSGFTNEVGVDGTIRYLRNIMGLWLLQESLRTWGAEESLPSLLAAAADAPPFAALVDPGDQEFLAPGDMPARIAAHCERTGQRPPADRAATVRCIIESLAIGHRAAIREAARLSGRAVDVVHVVGGGARNALLCRLTADACGLPVVAGPVEATAIGNALVQARAHGFTGDPRDLVRRTQDLTVYRPSGDDAAWDRAASRIGLS